MTAVRKILVTNDMLGGESMTAIKIESKWRNKSEGIIYTVYVGG